MVNSELCCIPECNKPVLNKKRGYCGNHYRRFLLYGDPCGGRMSYGAAPKRLEQLLELPPTEECIPWEYHHSEDGQPKIYYACRVHYVSRLLCELRYGKRDTMQASRNCGNIWCVNPYHIVWRSRAENYAHRARLGNTQSGDRNPLAKLTGEQAKAIYDSTESVKVLAAKYGVQKNTIRAVKAKYTWRWIHEK